MHLPACEAGTERVFRNVIQTPGNYQEESIQHPEHGESLKSTTQNCYGTVLDVTQIIISSFKLQD